MYVASKPETCVDESFEDLLLKYKQIQLELECIRNQERSALKPGEDSPHREQEDTPAAGTTPGLPQGAETLQSEQQEMKAFTLRPLRQKLLTPAERDALNAKSTPEAEQKEAGPNEEKKEEVKNEAEKSLVEPPTPNGMVCVRESGLKYTIHSNRLYH